MCRWGVEPPTGPIETGCIHLHRVSNWWDPESKTCRDKQTAWRTCRQKKDMLMRDVGRLERDGKKEEQRGALKWKRERHSCCVWERGRVCVYVFVYALSPGGSREATCIVKPPTVHHHTCRQFAQSVPREGEVWRRNTVVLAYASSFVKSNLY